MVYILLNNSFAMAEKTSVITKRRYYNPKLMFFFHCTFLLKELFRQPKYQKLSILYYNLLILQTTDL